MSRTHFSIILILTWVLLSTKHVSCYEVCNATPDHYYYCGDGYHCCNDNTQCCDDGLSYWQFAGLCFGIGLFFGCIYSCFRCRNNNAAKEEQRLINNMPYAQEACLKKTITPAAYPPHRTQSVHEVQPPPYRAI